MCCFMASVGLLSVVCCEFGLVIVSFSLFQFGDCCFFASAIILLILCFCLMVLGMLVLIVDVPVSTRRSSDVTMSARHFSRFCGIALTFVIDSRVIDNIYWII